ncbi:MAG: Inhibitor of apoptosis-promoting Bax1 [Microgenomates bacterium OLB22]|nr:MAG: Inhibitor of apoptosis-promoting Bax1 [Microgenomates bacterium OLB22]
MICVWTAFGIGLSAVGSYLSRDMKLSWPLLIGVLIVGFAGIYVAASSENPLLSLIGYSMVAIPFGFMLGPVVALYTTVSVMKVFVITSAVVVVLGFIGAVIPDSLDSWGGPLMGLLLCSIIGYLIVPFSGFFWDSDRYGTQCPRLGYSTYVWGDHYL